MEEGYISTLGQCAIVAARMANLSGTGHEDHIKMLQLKHQFPRRKQRDG